MIRYSDFEVSDEDWALKEVGDHEAGTVLYVNGHRNARLLDLEPKKVGFPSGRLLYLQSTRGVVALAPGDLAVWTGSELIHLNSMKAFDVGGRSFFTLWIPDIAMWSIP